MAGMCGDWQLGEHPIADLDVSSHVFDGHPGSIRGGTHRWKYFCSSLWDAWTNAPGTTANAPGGARQRWATVWIMSYVITAPVFWAAYQRYIAIIGIPVIRQTVDRACRDRRSGDDSVLAFWRRSWSIATFLTLCKTMGHAFIPASSNGSIASTQPSSYPEICPSPAFFNPIARSLSNGDICS